MTAYARLTDPTTSHEAAAHVNTYTSEEAVADFIRRYMPRFFVDAQLVDDYRHSHYPTFSESRIRTARAALARAGRLHCAGTTTRTGRVRREQVWSVDQAAAEERRRHG